MPTYCPSCSTTLIERGPFTVCPNGFACPSQLAGRMIHLGSRNALDIEGLGDETAKLLVIEGLVKSLPELFDLRAEQLVPLEGFAEKSARALVDGVRTAAQADLDRFLFGLGIPEVGRTVARQLASHFGSLDALRSADVEHLEQVDGVGPIMAEAIAGFFADPYSRELLDELLADRIELQQVETPEIVSSGLEGMKFVLTGTLPSMTREEAKAEIESRGGKVVSSVSGKTSYVVVGENPGSKAAKAADLGVPTVDEAALVELFSPAD